MDPQEDARDIPTERTARLVAEHLPRPSRILEIGCGDGRLAATLLGQGHEVVALDVDRSSVTEARQRGVDARLASWPDFPVTKPFDALLFTRSLHHIHPLEEAVRAAREHLMDAGFLFVEDWAWEEVDAPTAEVTARIMNLVRAAGITVDDPWSPRGANAHTEWHKEHASHLHSWSSIRDTIADHFRITAEHRTPYFYRYLARYAPALRDLTLEALSLEATLIERGVVRPIGRTLAAHPK